MGNVTLEKIVKIYDKNRVIDDVSFEVKDKEFVVLVGASGCGKSTLLRMIAGLESITSGTISIDGKIVNDVSPKDRDIAFVFQSYALYPHMNVKENISFGLKMRGEKKDVIEQKVNEACEILDLTEYINRYPRELSGGQRQRVALGRAIVRKPKVFLMDEPLSNLDAKLRVQMRSEIKKLHKKLNATFIYVTHDQTEALTMGDRICILNEGKIQQFDTPENVYNHPANTFVAGFIGSLPMNFLDGALLGKPNMILGVRPEKMLGGNDIKFSAPIDTVELLGSEKIVYFEYGNKKCSAKTFANHKCLDNIEIGISLEDVHHFDKTSGRRL